jgi:hypothetical protein
VRASSKLLRPYLGTWEDPVESVKRAVFTVAEVDGKPQVTGIDESDGEPFQVHDVLLDAAGLHFTTVMPSTGHSVKHLFERPSSAGDVVHAFTLTETWRRRTGPTTATTRSKPRHAKPKRRRAKA